MQLAPHESQLFFLHLECIAALAVVVRAIITLVEAVKVIVVASISLLLRFITLNGEIVPKAVENQEQGV